MKPTSRVKSKETSLRGFLEFSGTCQGIPWTPCISVAVVLHLWKGRDVIREVECRSYLIPWQLRPESGQVESKSYLVTKGPVVWTLSCRSTARTPTQVIVLRCLELE